MPSENGERGRWEGKIDERVESNRRDINANSDSIRNLYSKIEKSFVSVNEKLSTIENKVSASSPAVKIIYALIIGVLLGTISIVLSVVFKKG